MQQVASKKKSHKSSFGKSALIIAAGGILCKIIGAIYRIPLTNALGSEGIGLYQLVYSVYALFVVIVTGGITQAISRLVAEGDTKCVKNAFWFCFALSLLMTVVLVLLNKTFAYMQGSKLLGMCYFIIAPSVFFVGISSVFKGYFYGKMKMGPPTVCSLIEQTVKLVLGLTLAFALIERGIDYALYGALLAVTASEILSFVYVAIAYLVTKGKEKKDFKANSIKEGNSCRKDKIKRADSQNKQAKRAVSAAVSSGVALTDAGLNSQSEAVYASGVETDDKTANPLGFLKIAFPFALIALLLPLSGFSDSFMIVALTGSKSLYGVYSGSVTTLINMPIMILLSLAVAVVPSVSKERAQRDVNGILLKTRLSIKLCLLIGVPAALLMLIFSQEILKIIFPVLTVSELEAGANLLRIMSLSVVFSSMAQIAGSILGALDKTRVYVLAMICGIAVKTALLLILSRYISILAAGVASVSLSLVTLVINLIYLTRYLSLDKLDKSIAYILVSSLIIALSCLSFKYIFVNIYVAFGVALAFSLLLYPALIAAFDVLSKEETQSLPMSGFLLKYKRKIRFWDKEV
ncbi:polysaccharide biosynthesis protein [Acidaminococcus sp. CAG:917]|nr:polysaccharide biosynthesis protein [Acidaminococcus sp. CAG:917]